LTLKVNEEEAKDLAANSMNANPEELVTLIHKDIFFIFGRQVGEKQQLRLIDHRGFIKVQCGDAIATTCRVKDWEVETKKLWDKQVSYRREMLSTPDIYLCIAGKVLDFSNTLGFDQLRTVMASEFLDAEPDEEIILISSRSEIL